MQEQIEALRKEFNKKLEALKEEYFTNKLKPGSWVKYTYEKNAWLKHPTNIFRIKEIKAGTQGGAKGCTFLYPYPDVWSILPFSANEETKYFVEATEEEITAHLKAEALERGYEEGTVVIDLDGDYPNKIEGKTFQPYYPSYDYFYMCRTKIYQSGKWAKFAEEDIMIGNQYKVHFRTYLSPSDTAIDGYTFNKEFWEAAKIISEHSKAKIMIGCSKQFDVSLETINKILDRLKK